MVEIKIDTKKDSADDIRKAIEFLKNFLESGSDEYDSVSPRAMNIFSDDEDNSDDSIDEDNEEEKEDMQIKPMFY